VGIPEPLVTIRSYSTPHFAVEDRDALLEAGIAAYFGGRYYRNADSASLRVPKWKCAPCSHVWRDERGPRV
jgi:hypothetical protein